MCQNCLFRQKKSQNRSFGQKEIIKIVHLGAANLWYYFKIYNRGFGYYLLLSRTLITIIIYSLAIN